MVQEFTKNIQRLFTKIVADKHQKCVHNADELLAVLQRKVTLPVSAIKDGKHIRLVYDNVTVELRHDLSSMQIVYNSDYQLTLDNLSSYDVHQLAEFVLSLERDIPRWRHIWMAENKVSKMRLHMQDRVKSIMSEMRTVWESQYPIKDNLIQQYRLRYYNLKACQLMLNIGNPYWENKTTEQEILEECQLYHINAPIESWCEEYDELLNQCNKLRDERERKLEEQKRQREKEHHLAQLKKQKFQAYINMMEFYPGFNVTIQVDLVVRRKHLAPTFFAINFCINKDVAPYSVYYTNIDKMFPKIIDAIKRINDIMPDLNRTLKDDTPFYYAKDNQFAVQICKIIEGLISMESQYSRQSTGNS